MKFVKKIKLIICIFLLVGCGKQEVDLKEKKNSSASTKDKEANCMYVKEDSHIITVYEAMDIFQNKFGEVLGENTKIETPGVTEYYKRLYYYIRTYEDYPKRRTYTGNYGVDIYTGELYDLTLLKKVE